MRADHSFLSGTDRAVQLLFVSHMSVGILFSTSSQRFEVVALARRERSLQAVKALGAVPFVGDMPDAGLVEGMKGCQTLINAAADTDHGHENGQPSRISLEGTRNVFQSALTAGVSRAVRISTESVLLDGGPLINTTEDHPLPHRPAVPSRWSPTHAGHGRPSFGFSSYIRPNPLENRCIISILAK
jgi:hypothetical protein